MSSQGGDAKPASGGRGAAAPMVGGMRTSARRTARGQQRQGSDSGAQAPSGNQNSVMRFCAEDGSGLKVGPVTVLVASLAFMCIVVILHILSKFQAALTAAPAA